MVTFLCHTVIALPVLARMVGSLSLFFFQFISALILSYSHRGKTLIDRLLIYNYSLQLLTMYLIEINV